jgi:alpha-galactosidase
MVVDTRFSLSIGEADGQKVLRFSCARDLDFDEPQAELFSASFTELGELCGLGGDEIARFAADPGRAIFSNGWQSWCFAGELIAGERVPRSRIVPNLNVYTDGPCPNEAPGEVRSYFFTYVRSEASRLCLVSRGDTARILPPVAFRIARGSLDVEAEVAAEGARLERGDPVAEIRLFHCDGFFAAKDAMRDAFREYGQFERLGFLGGAGAGAAGKSGARLVPGGYESWYNHYTHIDEGIIARDLDSIGGNDNLINAYYLRRGKPTVFQIDDGWETAVGQWEPDPLKFPRGMKALASEIEGEGMVPGIWLAPLLVTRSSAAYRERPEWLLRDARGRPVPAGFNPGWDGVFYCLDISLSEVEDYLAKLFDTIVEDWGYRYLKLDFLYAGFIAGARRAPGAAYEHYERLMRRLTSRVVDSRGRGVAYLGCGAPLEASYRHFPLMRIGADTKEQWEDNLLKHVVRHQGRPAAYTNMTHTIGRALLDGTVFLNDPDVVFCRSSRMKLSEGEKELVALVDGLLASQLMFSDDTHEFGEDGEAAFTARVVGLYDRLTGGEYGAERIEKDVYSVFSRDGRVKGVANLSEKRFRAGGFAGLKAIVAHAESAGGGTTAFAPRSISLYED